MEPSKFASMLHRRTNKITRVLIYVVLEWALIFLLLLNSLFSYFILKFALYFGLKPPCLFCSRLDHHHPPLLESQKESSSNKTISSYKNIICEEHAAELSKIGYCSEHRKLVESRIMCEDCSSSSCLSSQQRNTETHDAPLFKWMKEIGLVKEDEDDVKKCSCCDVTIKPRKISSPLNFMANLITERELDGCFPDQEKTDDLVMNQREFESSDFGYQVLDDGEEEDEVEVEDEDEDVLSEAEKEPLLNSNDDVILTTQNLSCDNLPQHLEFYIDHDDYRLIPVQLVGDSVNFSLKREFEEIEKDENLGICGEVDLVFEGDELLAGCEVKGKNLMSIQEEEEEQGEVIDTGCGRGGEESTSQQQLVAAEEEEEEEELPTIGLEIEEMIAAEEEEEKQVEEHSQVDDSLLMVAAEEEEKQVEEHIQVNDSLSMVAAEEEEEEQEEKEPPLDSQGEDGPREIENLTVIQEQVSPDLNSARTVYNEEVESHLRRDGSSTEKNENLTVDELPSSDENDGKEAEGEAESCMESLNEVEEERIPDTPTSTESLHLHKKLLLLGRRGSVTEESLDGSIISEHEGGGDGGATVDKLKSELQAERKTLRALYAELEEERNASAIAANQTMAMINRLQEEKASMQMEALQYQRMMEEQSEYDQEALQMMNELMVKREKEKQELEKELEVYRKKLIDFEEREKMRILSRRMEGSMRSRNSSASCSYGEESDGLSIDLNHEGKDQEEDSGISQCREENGHLDTPTDAVLNLQESLASFHEDERQSILEQLKVLEEKLFTLSEEEEEHIEPFEQFYEENGKDFDDSYKLVDSEANGEENGLTQVNGKHQERWLNGSMPKRLLPLFDAAEWSDSPDGKEDGFDNKSPVTKFELEKKRLAIEEEVDHVYERLQALEADREFLKHCIGSLRKGDKGLDLLQEILQHLRDLKNVELQVLKNMDPCASL